MPYDIVMLSEGLVSVMLAQSEMLRVSRAQGAGLSRNLSYYPQKSEKSVSDDEDADSVHSKDSGSATDYDRSGRSRGRYKQRDVRRSKSEVRPSDLRQAEDEFNRKKSGGGGEAESKKASLTLSLVSPAHANQVSVTSFHCL